MYLLDTHILLWAAAEPEKLSDEARNMLFDSQNQLFFSAVSIWEIVIKNSLGRNDFNVNARIFRSALLNNGYYELPVQGEHVLAVESLTPIHKDPFDRMLIAQAAVEGLVLLSADTAVTQYPGSIKKI